MELNCTRRPRPAQHRARVLRTLLPALIAGLLAACTSATVPTAVRTDYAETGLPAGIDMLIESRVAVLAGGETLELGGITISEGPTLREFYTRRAFRPAWTDADTRDALVRAIRASALDGLNPDDYHLDTILALQAELAAPRPGVFTQADAELVCSDALALLAHHYAFGKVDPAQQEPTWNVEAPGADGDAAATLDALLNPDLQARLAARLPDHPLYRMLRTELVRLRMIAARGGWPALPPGETLKPGMQDPRVPLLRERLVGSGDLSAQAVPETTADIYDDALLAAVQRFQKRHGLTADGAIGRDSLKQLNTPVAARIDTVRVNLDRARVLLRALPPRFVVVNIAGFHVYLIENGRVVWDARAVVGQRYRETPLFRSEITYLQLNPDWTVPPGIIQKDILPDARKDPARISKRGLKVIDRQGHVIDPHSVNWSAFRSGNIPYTLRQPPGPTNALGRVKFMFPNDHAVYLHDTPTKNLFDRDDRTFSSGCVRVEDPLTLARLLINEPEWDDARIAEVLDGNETQTVVLRQRVPVLLAYWTAWPEADGSLNFRRDVYGRDARWLAALDGTTLSTPSLPGPPAP